MPESASLEWLKRQAVILRQDIDFQKEYIEEQKAQLAEKKNALAFIEGITDELRGAGGCDKGCSCCSSDV